MRYSIIFIFTCLLAVFSLHAQNPRMSDSNYGTMICAWEKTNLQPEPGKRSGSIATLFFGEIVEKLGKPTFIREANATYIKVRSTDGKIGWVNQDLFVDEGGLVAVLESSRIYLRPNTISTATMDYFSAGEVAILGGTTGNFIFLISKGKEKRGWIKDLEHVSIEGDDIEVATLYQLTLEDPDLSSRKKKLQQLMNIVRDNKSELRPVIEAELKDLRDIPIQKQSRKKVIEKDRDFLAGISNDVRNRKVGEDKEDAASFNYDFQDPISGKWYKSTVETGSIYLVDGPSSPNSVYFAYHKDLPLGSKILLNIPSNSGFIELEVVNRLRKNNPGMIGLSRDCVKAIFGSKIPKEVTITYLRE